MIEERVSVLNTRYPVVKKQWKKGLLRSPEPVQITELTRLKRSIPVFNHERRLRDGVSFIEIVTEHFIADQQFNEENIVSGSHGMRYFTDLDGY